MLAIGNFDSKAKKALGYMNTGQQMPRDGQQAVIRTRQAILHEEVHGNNGKDHQDLSDACGAGTDTNTSHYLNIGLIILYFTLFITSCMQNKPMMSIYLMNMYLMSQWNMMCLLVIRMTSDIFPIQKAKHGIILFPMFQVITQTRCLIRVCLWIFNKTGPKNKRYQCLMHRTMLPMMLSPIPT